MPSTQDRRFISLKPLYDFAHQRRDDEQPLRLNRTRHGRGYSAVCATITKPIDGDQGFYLWGHYDKKRYWHSLYLGKVGFGKVASLRARVLEELKDERWFIWRHVFTEEQVLAYSDEMFPGDGHRRACGRALRKAGATHVIWVPAHWVSAENVLRVEADLIEAINPKENIMKPTPPKSVQKDATRIFQSFRRTIHFARESAFQLLLS